MRKWTWFLSLLFLFSPLCFAAGKAIVLTVDTAIGPATQDYIQRGIAFAEKEHASLVIIELNTPGGLETSMRGINEAIITSPIPVATYVAPAGARAASAGTFILYASHFAAMAPGTNIGAASPVNITGGEESNKKPSTMEKKAMNDASAYIRSLAQLRGRNAAWGESAVRQATSLSADEAKKIKVIDDIAVDYPQLLHEMNGRTVSLQNKPSVLKTQTLTLEKYAPGWRHDFLSFLTNPNVAYILLLIAMYGLFFELSNPGAILPGVAGVIALLLVLYAFQLLPVNYAGLLLLVIGIGFIVAEVYVSSFGALGIGGAIAFIIGSIMLFDIQDPYWQISWSLIGVMSIITSAFFLMVATLAMRSHKKAITTGREGLISKQGIVVAVTNEKIIIQVQGELWEAHSNQTLSVGQPVRITNIHGLRLEVEPIQ